MQEADRMPSSTPATIKRKVFFYRVRMRPVGGETPTFDPEAVYGAVQALNAGADRYHRLEDGHAVRVAPTRVGSRVGFSMGMVRNSGLPRLESLLDGSVRPLALADDSGLVEETHVILLEGGIIGAEFNFYGPRVGRLVNFLQAKCPTLPRFTAEMLLNQDAAEEVRRLRDVRLVELRLGRSYVDLLQQAEQSLPDSLDAMLENVGGRRLEIVLKPEKGRGKTLSERALGWVRGIAGLPRTKEGAEHFKVRGMDELTDRVETFDLLRDKLVSSRQVVRQDSRHRGVDPDSMFDEIGRAFEENRPLIERAVGVSEVGP
jgi:hypothetical protein